MKSSTRRCGFWSSFRSYWRWKRANAVGALSSTTVASPHDPLESTHSHATPLSTSTPTTSASSSTFSAPSIFSFGAAKPPSQLDVVKRVVQERSSCHQFDPTKPVSLDLTAELLTAATRSPSAFNLQPWVSIVVHEEKQRTALARAVLDQSQPHSAPITVVFAGDMEPYLNAPAVLELGLDTGYTPPMVGPSFLRFVYYELHNGPLSSMACAKSLVSSWYSERTGNAMLSVPTTMRGYAWKQSMVPATTFMYLAEAAGLSTCMLEGFDEAQVRRVVELPDRYTVTVVVCIGYPAEGGIRKLRSPRFSPQHLIRWGKF